MMEWEEFEAKTQAKIQEKLDTAAELRRKEQDEINQARRQKLAADEKARMEVVAQMSDVLKDLRAKEILEAMGKGVWKEGEVHPFETINPWNFANSRMNMGYKLESLEFPVPAYTDGAPGWVNVDLKQERSVFTIKVVADVAPQPDSKDWEIKIALVDQGLYNVRRGKSLTGNMADAIKEADSEKGIRNRFPSRFRAEDAVKGLEPQEMQDEFDSSILAMVNNRRNLGSLPGQIRE